MEDEEWTEEQIKEEGCIGLVTALNYAIENMEDWKFKTLSRNLDFAIDVLFDCDCISEKEYDNLKLKYWERKNKIEERLTPWREKWEEKQWSEKISEELRNLTNMIKRLISGED